MPDWSYPQTNAQAGPSNPANSRNRSRPNPDITYTHWSQQHLETNPNAGFELLQGLMQMSGSHDPPPLLPGSAFRRNSTEELSYESTLSVLSTSTRNTDYALGTPYSIMSNSSSSAYPVSNTVPDIPLTSWMLQPETNSTKKQQLVNGSNSYQNGTIGGSSHQGSMGSPTNQSVNRYSNAMTGSQMQGTSQQSSYRLNDSYASQQNSDGFRVPFSQPSAPSLHIRRDGHLPASLKFQAGYGVEEGEIVDSAQFVDSRDMVGQPKKGKTEDDLWGPSRTGGSSGRLQAHVQPHGGTHDSGRFRAKGKEKEISVQYHTELLQEDAAWLGNVGGQDEYSQESGSDEEDALARDGYMRNCEPMIKSEKRTFKSIKLLGSVPSRATSVSYVKSTVTNYRSKNGSSQINLEHSPQSTTSSLLPRGSKSVATSDAEDDDVTSSPCQPGQRQRFAYVELPPWNYKNPALKAQYIYMDLPPLPLSAQKPTRKAAISARSLVDLAWAQNPLVEDESEEEHTESEEEDEGVAELVIEGDKFLTRDDNGDASKVTCHQCRESNRDAKMVCGNAKENCDLKYCKECVQERYNFRFQADSRLFICPVCQGYCNCAPCLKKSKLIEKLHLAEIMCGSREEFERILNKYKNVQRFLEAMGATKAPPVPRTIIHGIRLVSKAEDKKSVPIPQDVYLELTKPETMEVTYQSMISLAGPVTWAFPKKSTKQKQGKKRKNPNETFEKDDAEEESESDFDERAERKKSRKNTKRPRPPVARQPNATMSSMPVIPFEFAVDSQGAILFGDDGCPVINPVVSSASPTKRKQVTFSQNLGTYDGAADGQPTSASQFEAQPQQLSAESTRRAIEFIQQQLQRQQQHRDDPESHPDFQLDPTLQAFFAQQNDVDESVTLASAAALLPPGSATIEDQQHFANSLSEVGALVDLPQGSTVHAKAMPSDMQDFVQNVEQSVSAENRRADMDPFDNSPNMDTQTFDTVVAQIQRFQNVWPTYPNTALDAIFDVEAFSMLPPAGERQYNSAIDEGSNGMGSDRGRTLDESFPQVEEGEMEEGEI